jgi:HEPN domain-containing protein
MEMSKRQVKSKAWMEEARYDFETCLELHELDRYNWVCTCSQQASEKAVKALFLLEGINFPWTHSIVDLLDELKESINIDDEKFFDLRHSASELDPHYIETRYPDAIGGTQAPYKYYDKQRSENCLNNTRKVLEWVEKQIQSLKE